MQPGAGVGASAPGVAMSETHEPSALPVVHGARCSRWL